MIACASSSPVRKGISRQDWITSLLAITRLLKAGSRVPMNLAVGLTSCLTFSRKAADNPTFYADSTQPQTLNKYQYCLNNPHSFIDPDGHQNQALTTQLMIQRNPKEFVATTKAGVEKVIDRVQLGLSVTGAAPVVGEAADGINAGISAARGNYIEALIDGGAALTGPLGNILSIGKKAHKIANTADAAKDVRDTGKATEGVYEFVDKANEGKTYVGQSGNIPARLKQHERNGRLAPVGGAKTKTVRGGKTKREVAEQKRLDQLGGPRNNPGSRTSNIRNPVSVERMRKLRENDRN